MLNWLNRFRRPRTAATPVAPRANAPQPPSESPPGLSPPTAPATLAWLLDTGAPQERPLTPEALRLLQGLDDQLAAPRLPADLLPRAAGVLPQLMRLMRQEQPSRAALSQQVLRDVVLTTEVLRLAHSSFYGGQPAPTLDAALDRIGLVGLQSATARVLLKPVFDHRGSGLAARAGDRLWQHADMKSMFCAELAHQHGAERFDALLAGLLHDMAWLALLRLLDRLSAPAASAVLFGDMPFSAELERRLSERRDRLFGRLASDWDLSPALSELATALGQPQRKPTAPTPLLNVLGDAERHCAEALATPPAARAGADS